MGNARAARGQEDNLKLSYNFDYTTLNWFAFSTLDCNLKILPKLDWINFFPILCESVLVWNAIQFHYHQKYVMNAFCQNSKWKWNVQVTMTYVIFNLQFSNRRSWKFWGQVVISREFMKNYSTLRRLATRLIFRPLMRSIIYHWKAPNVLFHVYLNHFSYFSKLTSLLANDWSK